MWCTFAKMTATIHQRSFARIVQFVTISMESIEYKQWWRRIKQNNSGLLFYDFLVIFGWFDAMFIVVGRDGIGDGDDGDVFKFVDFLFSSLSL